MLRTIKEVKLWFRTGVHKVEVVNGRFTTALDLMGSGV
jgi:hypothetical protein